jgi:hypothetical protein
MTSAIDADQGEKSAPGRLRSGLGPLVRALGGFDDRLGAYDAACAVCQVAEDRAYAARDAEQRAFRALAGIRE